MRALSSPVRRHTTFSQVLLSRAAERPDQIAYRFLPDGESQDQTLTYRQVERRAKAVAVALREAGAVGQRALLLLPPGLDFISAFWGCLCSGTVAVPASPPRAMPSRANDRISGILHDANPVVVLTTRKLLETIRKSIGRAAVQYIVIDDLKEYLADQWEDPNLSSSDLACLQYTSGSTAEPKGVMLTHANLIHNAHVVCEAFGHAPGMTGVLWLPPYHDMGLAGGILQPIYSGGSVVLMPPSAFLQEPLRWLRAISRYKAVTSGGPNFAYEFCVRSIGEEDRATLDLSSWEIAFNGSERVEQSTLDQFAAAFGRCGFMREAFYPCYGLAESTLMVTGGPKLRPEVLGAPSDEANVRGASLSVSCGFIQGGGELLIIDPATLRRCPQGHVGEIWVSGESVAAGYWNKLKETQETFGARPRDVSGGPFLRTGDLGFVRGRELFVTGRLKDQINIRGIKHEPRDIERTAEQSHPALQPAGAAAFSVPIDGEEKLIVCQEVQRTQRGIGPDGLIAAIRAAVSGRHEVEVYAILLLKPGHLPRTSSGRVQRFACRDAYLKEEFELLAEWCAQPRPQPPKIVATGQIEHPMSDESLEQWMTRRLAVRLGVAPTEIDPTLSFSRYGLDSVMAASLAADLSAHLQREVPMMLFWDRPSIRALASHLRENRR